ncbi:hypothetical protein [Microvirga lotononidis]|nr:hypothetical protein [Microvirga lotononidis]WQO29353.1 hypothetical protein U0023_09920 [Microvirga lotononidis]
MPDWDLRYHSFNAHWGEGEMMASMRNGEGDNCFILFNPHGVFVRGHAVGMRMERPSTEPSLLQTVPAEFHAALQEPAFSFEKATFCRWATWESEGWGGWPARHSSHGDRNEARRVLSILDGNPRTYQAWAEGYYGKALVASAIDAIYAHRTLESDLVHALNPDRSMTDLAEEIREIGYPSTLPGGGS